MKKLFALLIIGITLASCVSKQSAERMQGEIDSLQVVVDDKEAMINDIFASMAVITDNIAQIKQREGIITVENSESVSDSAFAKMSDDLTMIDQLLADNRARIADLEKKAERLKKANTKISGLEKLISELNSQMDSQQKEITELKANLAEMGLKVENLTEEVAQKSQQVENLEGEKRNLEAEVTEKNTQLHTAHYIIAPEKQLISDNIIAKRGVLGRTLAVTESPNMNLFTSTDTRILKSLNIGRKGVSVITSHPEGSYWLVESEEEKGLIESLVIVDQEKFWSLSKILVISHK